MYVSQPIVKSLTAYTLKLSDFYGTQSTIF